MMPLKYTAQVVELGDQTQDTVLIAVEATKRLSPLKDIRNRCWKNFGDKLLFEYCHDDPVLARQFAEEWAKDNNKNIRNGHHR